MLRFESKAELFFSYNNTRLHVSVCMILPELDIMLWQHTLMQHSRHAHGLQLLNQSFSQSIYQSINQSVNQ